MANKTLVSIDDMIAKYRSEFDRASKEVQDLLDNASFTSSLISSQSDYHDFCDKVRHLTSELQGMLRLIFYVHDDDDFYISESECVSSLLFDTIHSYNDRSIKYLENLHKEANGSCYNS